MGRKKSRKFNDIKDFDNVLEWGDPDVKNILEKKFGEYEKITLELGCGKGEYTVGLGRKNPNTLFLGVDIQGERIWRGAKTALEEGLENVMFLRTRIENIEEYIGNNSVDEIWITFPDPFPKDSDSKRRLTSHRFWDIYRRILKKGGTVYLKTDSKLLYEYTLEVVKELGIEVVYSIEDIYSSDITDEDLIGIQTTFEKKHLEGGEKIKVVSILV